MSTVAVGQTVELKDGRHAVVRFVGNTTFAPGQWIGVELEEGGGKNDGSVQGERYFECDMGRGMFLRITAVSRVVEEPARAPEDVLEPHELHDVRDVGPEEDDVPEIPPKASAAAPSGMRRPRPSSFNPPGTRQASASSDPNLGRRMSINAPSPTPASRTARISTAGIKSPTKSPSKQHGSGPPSRTVTPAGSKPVGITKTRAPAAAASARAPMPPPPPMPATKLRQASVSTTASSTSRPGAAPQAARSAGSRLFVGADAGAGAKPPHARAPSATLRRPSTDSQTAASASVAETPTGEYAEELSPTKSEAEILSPQPQSPAVARANTLEKMVESSPEGRSRSGANPAEAAAATAQAREIEDLRAKVRVLDRRRQDDREKLKLLDKIQGERDKFEGIIQKLQAKYQPQQQDNVELKRMLKEAESRLGSVEQLQAMHDEDLELATLDREMAEEQAENLKLEVDALKARAEELELELEVVREENAELTAGMSPEERSHTGWIQMERTNERLREALMRLRDLARQQDEESREQIRALEDDLRDHATVKTEYEAVRESLETSRAHVEDLRQQLDTALGAEDMIEELTDQNGAMAERMEELRVAVRDLETLKEISDDLELNHVQNEREMQEDLDFKDAVIAEQARRAAQREQQLEDMEYTVSRFRELVTNLQGDLDDMRASNAVTESEQEKLNDRSRAMMDLNMKLRLSAAKAQVKTIDLELRRLEAQEAGNHLEIVRLYLPDSYREDQDSVAALLRFRRVAFKAGLLQGFIKERVGAQPPPEGAAHEDDVFEGCDAVDKLTWVAAVCDRFVGSVGRCSVERFAAYRGALHELEPVERALDGWIDGLRRGDLREKRVAAELQRSVALLAHLAEVHITDDAAGFADEVLMRATVMQSHLDSAAVALGTMRAMVQRAVPAGSGDDGEGGETTDMIDADADAQHFAKQTELAVSQTRSTKMVAGKAVRAIEELRARSLALVPETRGAFEAAEEAARDLASVARNVGLGLHALLREEGRTEPCTYAEVRASMRASSVPAATPLTDSDILSTYLARLRTLAGQVNDLAGACGDLDQTREFDVPPPPWRLRAHELRSLQTVPVDVEDELRRVREELREAHRSIRLGAEDRGIATLRIETLEARMRDAQENVRHITELRARIAGADDEVAGLREDIEKQDRELKVLEVDRDRWKKMAHDSRAYADGADAADLRAGQERAAAAAREMQDLRDDLAGLQSAVRFLRDDNRRARTTEQHRYDWLAEPLARGPGVAERRRTAVAAEGRDALGELVRMASSARVFDLSALPADRLAWRPARATPQHHAARQLEEYAAWKGWHGSVARKSETLLAQERHRAGAAAARTVKKKKAAARLHVRLPGLEGPKAGVEARGGKAVRVVEPREWLGLHGRVITL